MFLLLSAICIFVVARYVRNERTIYFWDQAFYFNYFRDQTMSLAKAIESFQYTYTYLPILPLIVFRCFFGDSRQAHILSISVLYGLTALAVLCYGCMDSNKKISILGYLAFISIAFFNPQFWHAIVFGYPDVGGVLIAGVILILSKKKSDKALLSMGRHVLIGCLLALLVLFRRYYAYWTIGYVCASAVAIICTHSRSSKQRMSQLGLLLASIVIFITVLYLSLGKSFPVLFHSYGDMYSAYKTTNSFNGLIRSFLSYYGGLWGILVLLVFIVQGIYLPLDANSIYLFIITFLPIALLATVQDPGLQHWYLLFPGLIFSIYRSISILEVRIRSSLRRVFYAFAIMLVVFVFFISVTNSKNIGIINGFFPSERLIPQQRTDISNIYAMLKKLDLPEEKTNGQIAIYVLSSSDVLNDSLVREATKQFGFFRLSPNILVTSIIDKRDPFPMGLFEADYVLVPSENYSGFSHPQFVVDGLASLFLDERSILAPYYQCVDTKYILEYNTTINIYYRYKLIPNQIKNLLYSEWKEAR